MRASWLTRRTGTIIIGQHVKVSPAAITHGSLTVTIKEVPPVVGKDGTVTGGQIIVLATEKVLK